MTIFDQLLAAAREGTLDVPVRAPRAAGGRTTRDAVIGLARATHADWQAIEEPVWSAIDQYGGRITADYIQHRPGRWRIAGEFADIPKRLLKRPDHLNPNVTRVRGNLDQIADAAGMAEQDLKDFLATHPKRATFADAMREAKRAFRPHRRRR